MFSAMSRVLLFEVTLFKGLPYDESELFWEDTFKLLNIYVQCKVDLGFLGV